MANLERQLAARGGPGAYVRGVRKRASWELLGLPFYDIAMGPDPERGEYRGHARGFIAIGDMATGVIAVGGLARGVLAFGGLALGVVTFGGLSIGVLVAAGGLAIGSLAFGGASAGGVAVGGAALGYYACGGAAAGVHAVMAGKRDPEAVAFFAEHGLQGKCR